MASNQQQLIVKAYYNDLVESQPEIRRFSIDVSSANNAYRSLETTIIQLNNNYRQGEFTLQYIDEDNDRVTFSSDIEFRAALQQVAPGTTMKVYVKPKTKQAEKTSAKSDEPVVHPFVTCDGCQGSVVGNRYKCMQCPDYDLCQSCSDKNLHSEHKMMKITRPNQFGACGFGRRFGRGPFSGGRCGGSGRFWRNFVNRGQNPNETNIQFPPDMVNFLGQFTGKELAELVEAHLPEYLRTEVINKMLNEFKTGEQANKIVDHKVLLENVGKFLREILSPLGIDCDYFVDGNPAAQTTEQPAPTERKEEAAPSSSASATSSTEPKPSAPENLRSESSTNPMGPTFGNLLGQLGTMFNPILQQAMASNPTMSPSTGAEGDLDPQKIDDCIERMTAMGFVDTNGVLTELIKSKKGDINQVLDALNPRNYKN